MDFLAIATSTIGYCTISCLCFAKAVVGWIHTVEPGPAAVMVLVSIESSETRLQFLIDGYIKRPNGLLAVICTVHTVLHCNAPPVPAITVQYCAVSQ